MFFKKPKQKVDPRLRFQRASFTRKLDRAKGYQRHSQPVPRGAAAFLSVLGLDSVWSKLFVIVALAVLLVIIYLPQILFIRTITVTGASDSQNGLVRGIVEQYLDRHTLPWPQRNLLLLRRSGLSQFILSSDHSLARVASIKKKPFHGLAVTVQPKQERYVVHALTDRYLVYDDGTVKDVIAPESLPPANLIEVMTGSTAAARPGDAYFAPGFAAALSVIVHDFSAQTGGQTLASITLPISSDSFMPVDPLQAASPAASSALPLIAHAPPEPETLPLDRRDISIYTPKKQNGKDGSARFRVIVDAQADLPGVLAKLGMLLKSLGPEVYSSLSYIDMRLPDRAYTCAVHTPCDK